MRYEKGHKEATRRRIVETAAARFRRDGIETVGLADLMAEAGLTHGGFYSHFTSKEELVKAALAEASDRSRERFQKRTAEGGLENWIRQYLRAEHRDHPERGCVHAALIAEVGRHSKGTKSAFTEFVARAIHSISAQLPDSLSPAARRKTAVGVFGLLIGSLQMARAVTDPALSEEILEAGISSALALAGIKSAVV